MLCKQHHTKIRPGQVRTLLERVLPKEDLRACGGKVWDVWDVGVSSATCANSQDPGRSFGVATFLPFFSPRSCLPCIWSMSARRPPPASSSRMASARGSARASGDTLEAAREFLVGEANTREQLYNILGAEDALAPYVCELDFLKLCDARPALAARLATACGATLPAFHCAAVEAQEALLQRERQRVEEEMVRSGGRSGLETHELLDTLEVKLRVTVRVHMFGFPGHSPRIGGIRVEHVGRFVCLNEGTVIRSGPTTIIESQQAYRCTTCGRRNVQYADHGNNGVIDPPSRCASPDCEGEKFKLLDEEPTLQDYQEITVQENMQHLDTGRMPRNVKVILSADLANCCSTGDDVRIAGEVIYRWRQFKPGSRCEVDMVVVANHVHVYGEKETAHDLTPEMVSRFERFWARHANDPLKGRDIILSGICPQLYGMFIVKMAVMMMLIGGVPFENVPDQRSSSYNERDGGGRGVSSGATPPERGPRVRGDVHVLIVGDPGTGKSQFLKFAARVSHRAVLTSGMGSTAAGLTCAAVREGGEWSLEAGALVLADGGVCCIDEFNAIKATDRAIIHEAMEQQTISVAKAGLVAKLNTRTSVFGVMNPKGLYDCSRSVSENTTLSGPLMSRFDAVLVLLDTKDPAWDETVSSHILDGCPNSKTTTSDARVSAQDGGLVEYGCDSGIGDDDQALADPDAMFLDIDVMRSYVRYVRHKYKPKLTQSAERVLSAYFQNQRGKVDRNAARTTVRLFESLIRLAQAHARLMARDQALLVDAVFAVLTVESSMHTNSLLDVNCIQSGFADDPDGDYVEMEAQVLQMLGLSVS